MKKAPYLISLFAATVFSVSCLQQRDKADAELMQLRDWMCGSFSSQEQAAADTNFLDIRLEMVEIWKLEADTVWLYVEQAAAWALEEPYRQRVYRLCRRDAASFESAVFTIQDPLRFAGAWKEPDPLHQLNPDSLMEKNGCALVMTLTNETFRGSTDERNCPSKLRGASYATSEVVITENVLTSLDRGFDENNQQVWGSEFGPYIFKKIE